MPPSQSAAAAAARVHRFGGGRVAQRRRHAREPRGEAEDLPRPRGCRRRVGEQQQRARVRATSSPTCRAEGRAVARRHAVPAPGALVATRRRDAAYGPRSGAGRARPRAARMRRLGRVGSAAQQRPQLQRDQRRARPSSMSAKLFSRSSSSRLGATASRPRSAPRRPERRPRCRRVSRSAGGRSGSPSVSAVERAPVAPEGVVVGGDLLDVRQQRDAPDPVHVSRPHASAARQNATSWSVPAAIPRRRSSRAKPTSWSSSSGIDDLVEGRTHGFEVLARLDDPAQRVGGGRLGHARPRRAPRARAPSRSPRRRRVPSRGSSSRSRATATGDAAASAGAIPGTRSSMISVSRSTRREVDPVEQAAALERVVQLARPVRGDAPRPAATAPRSCRAPGS